MFTAIKTFDGTNRQIFEDWIDKVDQACRASNRGFRTELFKKSAGAVRQVILSCNEFSDDELVAKLRSCFSHAPTMNEARGTAKHEADGTRIHLCLHVQVGTSSV